MKTILKTMRFTILICILLFPPAGQAKAVIVPIVYVKGNVFGGAHDGTSWANAYSSLEVALAASSSSRELWVAAIPTSYKPTSGTDRAKTFTLQNGVAIYGGFVGTETNFSQRDPAAHITRLDGDLDGDRDYTDNSYHVVTASNTNSTAVLDGFTISSGNANGGGTQSNGGGIYNELGNPTLANLIISGNKAAADGGGMHNSSGSPHLDHVTFSNNQAQNGAGMNNNNASSPHLTYVIFTHNAATDNGGGMRNLFSSSPTLVNVAFNDNSAGLTGASGGGGMYNFFQSSPSLSKVTFHANSASVGGGMENYTNCNSTLMNVTFNGNSATSFGGGMYNYLSVPIMTNATFSSNTAPANKGGGLYTDSATTSSFIYDSLFWGNGSEIVTVGASVTTYDSLVQGGCPASGVTCYGNIINADPLLGPLASNGGFTQTMALGRGSPAIDKGNNSTCIADDQRGVSRWFDGDKNGVFTCDIGSYEFNSHFLFLPYIRR